MPRKFLRRYLPKSSEVRQHRQLRLFGALLGNPRLWHLNRHGVAGGLGVGVFWTFIPMPFQMIPSAATAILLRVNVPIALAGVWISNPITMAPMMYGQYRLGLWLMGSDMRQRRGFEPTIDWFWQEMANIWQPLMLGSLTCAVLLGMASYGMVHLIWRLHIRAQLRRRRLRARRKRPESS
ncbi:uncharacterized protein (DUF2062 family) [Natronocella acetinitrilica]|uniref:Uncharacterized protein (DUF2062 family) n=1 Tax=Natronocella acetinitrilica TaxID=414046 RepID=A0AAE3G6F9_9GAMM|nr:DUF2062 domain-containing protein [Natronocella acetinitrilica]MCP1676277.1 uncharacterized protein (DUF2062 family) [Natronocella acetinitrilica]